MISHFVLSPYFRTFSPQLTGIFCCLMFTACSTLPTHKTPSETFALAESVSISTLSPIQQQLQQQKAQHPQLTGYHLLANPTEALAARLALIHTAQHHLDLQYYIWHNDKIGAMTLHALMQAADRGVKIRLLIDDNNAQAIEGILFALNQHKNIQVKLFNPYRFRKYRGVDMLLDVKRINRRMHNKSLIADRQLSIIGGRNISNEYFNISHEFQFADIDVLLAGQANDDVRHSFDQYWQHDYAFAIQDVVKARHHRLRYAELKRQLNTFQQKNEQQHDAQTQHIKQAAQDFQTWLEQQLQLEWVEGKLLSDLPDKVKNQAPQDSYLYHQLMTTLTPPQQQLDIISAYFIPQTHGVQRLSQFENAGVDVRILTNSFQSTDVKGVHAYYSPYRKALLQNGVELYEFLPRTTIEEFMNSEQEITKNHRKKRPKDEQDQKLFAGASNSSLHAKSFIIDKKQVFIGSFNLDPRSIYYNTEMGVILNSPKLGET
ncbi:MAG: phospholipase D family protein, partial [Acinetobacter sp.]|nr:phospholipase D family protein [Acinetobacter sp.]